jgi:UDP-N-acetylglucosamine:LPS N-acetylglucosamine transferase
MTTRPTRVLAIASSGGHWVQLRRLAPAFVDHEVVYASVRPEDGADVAPAPYHVVADATRWDKVGMVRLALQVLVLLMRVRPDVIVSTGALPGFFAIRLGSLLRRRTVWIDSIANCEELSMSGRRVEGAADLWLTQWPELATPDGPEFAGAVL